MPASATNSVAMSAVDKRCLLVLLSLYVKTPLFGDQAIPLAGDWIPSHAVAF